MNIMINKLVEYLLKNEAITLEDADVIKYGFVIFMATVGKMFLIGLLFMFMGLVTEFICFVLGFCLLRVYAGGWHSKSFVICTVISICSIYFVIIAGKFLYDVEMYYFPLAFIGLSFVITYVFAPGDVVNRPLAGDEYTKFKFLSRIVVLFQLLIVTTLTIYKFFPEELYVFSVASLFQSINLFMTRSGKMKKNMVFLTKIAACFVAFASLGVSTRSLFFMYQPEIPEKLRKQ